MPQLRQGGAELRAFVQQRRPNVPLSAYGAEAVDKAEALTHLNIGLAIETVAELAELAELPARRARGNRWGRPEPWRDDKLTSTKVL